MVIFNANEQTFFRGTAVESRATHGIDIFKEHTLSRNYFNISKDLKGILETAVVGQPDVITCPVFVQRSKYEDVKGGFRFLDGVTHYHHNLGDIKVMILEDLFAALRAKAQEYLTSKGKPTG